MSCFLFDYWFLFSSRGRHTRCALVTGVQTGALPIYDCSGHALALRETNLGGIGVPILRRKGDPGGVHSKDKDQGDKDDIGEATRLVQLGRASCRERVCPYE